MDAQAQRGLRVVLREAFQAELGPLGFSRQARSKVWLRPADGLDHAVSVEGRYGSIRVRWDVVCPPVGEILHGRFPEPREVAYSGVITGTPQAAYRAGVRASASESNLIKNLTSTVDGIRLGVRQVAEWLDDYPSRPAAIAQLLAEPTDATRHRVTVPAPGPGPGPGPLRVFTAASFAAVDRAPEARALVERAIADSAPWKGRITDERNRRLLAALAG